MEHYLNGISEHWLGTCTLTVYGGPCDSHSFPIFFVGQDYFHVQLSDDKQVRHFLVLSYAGATLQDTWTLIDVGVMPGSAIRCLIKVVRTLLLGHHRHPRGANVLHATS